MAVVQAVLSYLIECNIIQSAYTHTVDAELDVVHIQPIGDVSVLHIHACDTLLEQLAQPTDGCCVVYVLPSSDHIHRSLSLCGVTLLQCLHDNILMLHVPGINRRIVPEVGYGLQCISATDDNTTNKQKVLELCHDTNTKYLTMSSLLALSTCSHIVRSLYYHECRDILATFGIDYVFCVYYTHKLYNIDIASTLYILREEEAVHIVRVLT